MAHMTETQAAADCKAVSLIKNKNERLSWKRKYDKLQETIKNDIQPIEEQMIELAQKKQDIMDSLLDLRKQMIKECVHPEDQLVHMGNYIRCKFCNVGIALPKMFAKNVSDIMLEGTDNNE